MKNNNCFIPLIGGPFCGECLQITNAKLNNKVPLYHEFKFHVYELIVDKFEDFTEIFYRFTGEVLDVGEVHKYKVNI